ncbi:MAG: cold-shock protein [Gaiellaceae bacterium]|jgi:cold shock CspA family protein
MEGSMLWFNVEKGYGYIQTEADERLYVASNGFLPGHEPKPRCKGAAVTFERDALEGEPRAVDVAFVVQDVARRARLRHSRGGSSL